MSVVEILAAQPATGAGTLGVPALIAVLLASDAGAPIPFPTDVLLVVLGERAASGVVPLWLAAAAVELIAIASTAVLFQLCRGPGHRLVTRLGPRMGLTADRMMRATATVERRGRAGLAIGRATPGLRTLTVVAAGGSGLRIGRALPALAVGSSIFLQLHLILGYVAGPAARDVLATVTVPLVIAVLALAVAGSILWLIRRRRGGRNEVPAIWHEGVCPACLAVAAVESRVRRRHPEPDEAMSDRRS